MESRSDSIPGEVACVAYIRQKFTSQGLSERVANMFLQSWRTQTHTLLTIQPGRSGVAGVVEGKLILFSISS